MTPPAPGCDRNADGRFEIVASEEHFRGHIVTVRVDAVTMPGGGVADREVVEHMPAVAVVALDDEGRVVLIEQYRHPLRRRLWELPAGLMDIDGEDAIAAARRELLEEVGLVAADWSVLVDIASSPGFTTEAIRIFLATGLTEAPAPPAEDEEADLRVIRIPLGDAVDAVLNGEIVNATAVAGLLAAARVLGIPGGAGAGRLGDMPFADSLALPDPAPRVGCAPVLSPETDRIAG